MFPTALNAGVCTRAVSYTHLQEDRIVGWYHSHPGYGCWLSNIDVQTQSLNQNYQDPYLAIVVDPKKSLKNKSLEIGAFRTLNNDSDNHYYRLSIQLYQNSLDADLSKLEFRFKMDKKSQGDGVEVDLFKELLECVENWSHVKKVMRSTVPINSIESGMARDDLQVTMNYVQERSNSISSTSSLTTRHTTDVEMDDQESVQSSLDATINPIPGVQFQEVEVRNEYELKKKRLLLLKLKQYETLKTYQHLFTQSG